MYGVNMFESKGNGVKCSLNAQTVAWKFQTWNL